jgi:hypothetical protein
MIKSKKFTKKGGDTEMKKVAILGMMAVILMAGVAVAVPAPAADAQVIQEDALVVRTVVVYANEVIPEDGIVEVGEMFMWNIAIIVTNNGSETIEDIVFKDNLGGELRLVGYYPWGTYNYIGVPPPINKKDTYNGVDGLHVQWTGKTHKAHLTWDVGDLLPGESVMAAIRVRTDRNTGTGNGQELGHQEYTEAGIHYLDSGATVKGMMDGLRLSDTANPLMVEVFEPN